MKILTVITASLCLLLLTACGNNSDEKPEELKGVIPEHQLKTLEKAKEVEQLLKDSDEKVKAALEQ